MSTENKDIPSMAASDGGGAGVDASLTSRRHGSKNEEKDGAPDVRCKQMISI